METLLGLERFKGPLLVSRLEHSLQSATHALRDSRDEEYVVAALMHDIGDHLAPYSHGEYVSSILKPYVSERVCWVIEKHPLFQAYYYAHHLGADRNARDVFIDHRGTGLPRVLRALRPELLRPRLGSLPPEHFEPMVRRVFAEPRHADWVAQLQNSVSD